MDPGELRRLIPLIFFSRASAGGRYQPSLRVSCIVNSVALNWACVLAGVLVEAARPTFDKAGSSARSRKKFYGFQPHFLDIFLTALLLFH